MAILESPAFVGGALPTAVPLTDAEIEAEVRRQDALRREQIRAAMAAGMLDPYPAVPSTFPAAGSQAALEAFQRQGLSPVNVQGVEGIAARTLPNVGAGGASGQMLAFPHTPPPADWTQDPVAQARLTAMELATRGAAERQVDPVRAAQLETFWSHRPSGFFGPMPAELTPDPGIGHFGRETERAAGAADALRAHGLTSTGVWVEPQTSEEEIRDAYARKLGKEFGIAPEAMSTDPAILGSLRTATQQAGARQLLAAEGIARHKWPGMPTGMAMMMEQPGNSDLRDMVLFGPAYVAQRNALAAQQKVAEIEAKGRVDAAQAQLGKPEILAMESYDRRKTDYIAGRLTRQETEAKRPLSPSERDATIAQAQAEFTTIAGGPPAAASLHQPNGARPAAPLPVAPKGISAKSSATEIVDYVASKFPLFATDPGQQQAAIRDLKLNGVSEEQIRGFIRQNDPTQWNAAWRVFGVDRDNPGWYPETRGSAWDLTRPFGMEDPADTTKRRALLQALRRLQLLGR